MSRRALFGYLILNVLVTFIVMVGVLLLNEARLGATPTPVRNLLTVIITATPDPNYTPPVVYIVVTATPASGIALQPTPPGGTPQAVPRGDVPTLDPALLPPNPEAAAGNPNACPTYTLVAGDTAIAIAQRYGVPLADLIRVNNLREADLTRLQIGQVLVIPIGGCGLATETPTPTATPSLTPSPPPTATLIPTLSAEQLKIEITRIISPGDITQEGIEIRNISGGVIEIGGWTLSDAKGNVYTFPNYQMFEGRRVVVYTRGGASTSTPLALFWGLPSAIWGDPDQVAVIRDAEGNIQARYSRRQGASVP
ncbi:MAG: lamin tail domain-containing protein [Anaerolineae bacterium]|nr:lamin tail domain-containing protein [Anaerolineae bacterium]